MRRSHGTLETRHLPLASTHANTAPPPKPRKTRFAPLPIGDRLQPRAAPMGNVVHPANPTASRHPVPEDRRGISPGDVRGASSRRLPAAAGGVR
jgi:hypothetical protein